MKWRRRYDSPKRLVSGRSRWAARNGPFCRQRIWARARGAGAALRCVGRAVADSGDRALTPLAPRRRAHWQKKKLEDKIAGIKTELAELKVALYGRFGKTINLDE